MVKASQMERWVKCQTAPGQKEMFVLIYPDTLNCNVLVINHAPGVGVTWIVLTPDSKKAKKGKLRQGKDLTPSCISSFCGPLSGLFSPVVYSHS